MAILIDAQFTCRWCLRSLPRMRSRSVSRRTTLHRTAARETTVYVTLERSLTNRKASATSGCASNQPKTKGLCTNGQQKSRKSWVTYATLSLRAQVSPLS